MYSHGRPKRRAYGSRHYQRRVKPQSSGCAVFLLMMVVESLALLGWWRRR